MREICTNFANDDRGSTAIEYALIAAVISVFIVGAVQAVTGQLGLIWGTVDTTVSTAINNASPVGK
jgi:pilus assembly protein Flp/PilA